MLSQEVRQHCTSRSHVACQDLAILTSRLAHDELLSSSSAVYWPSDRHQVSIIAHALQGDLFPSLGSTPGSLCNGGAWLVNIGLQVVLGVDALGLGFGLVFWLGLRAGV